MVSLFQEVVYYGKKAIVLDVDKTHCVIQFENGTKLCTSITTFNVESELTAETNKAIKKIQTENLQRSDAAALNKTQKSDD